MLSIFHDRKIIIWVVDDRRDNHLMIGRSFSAVSQYVKIIHIHSCDEYYQNVDKCTNHKRPHIIFMDFFMGENYGTDLVNYIKDKRYLVGFPIIIGHSSNPDASREIVKSGGDFILEKNKGLSESKEIKKYFGNFMDIIYIINNRRLPND